MTIATRTTPAGDSHSFAELEQMLDNSGFERCELHPLPPAFESAAIAQRR